MLHRSIALLFGATLFSTALGCSSAAVSAADDGATAADDDALSGALGAGTTLETTTNVNFRSAPVIGDNVIQVLSKGTPVKAAGGDPKNGFYAVTFGGTAGYLSAKYVSVVTAVDDGSDPDAGDTTTGSSGSNGNGSGNGSGSGGPFHVTYIGDSHSDYDGNARGAFGFLGQHLTELMAQDGIPIALYAASGSVPTWWFDGTSDQAATWGYTQTSASPPRRTCSRGSKSGACVPKLSAILSDAPSLFVIEQGTNMLGRSTSDITQEIATMLAQIQGKADACLWVGAPNARTSVHSQASQDALWSLIQQHAAPTCYVYDSRFLPKTDAAGEPVLDAQGNLVMNVPLPYSPDANNDGEHFGMTSAGKWAQGVAQMIVWIQNHH